MINMVGRAFGYWLVVDRATNVPDGHAAWNCICVCGARHRVNGNYLRRGRTISCGCIRIKHAHSKRRHVTPTYRSWASMVQRCTNPKRKDFLRYGGRGISVCDRWLKSFSAFLADMGERPPGTTLDRIDNNGNYEPGNCCWSTISEQNYNQRSRSLDQVRAGV
jgi:hypothetical protein